MSSRESSVSETALVVARNDTAQEEREKTAKRKEKERHRQTKKVLKLDEDEGGEDEKLYTSALFASVPTTLYYRAHSVQ